MAYYRNIGLIGRARVGKDTVAARLGQRFGYQRVAFADTLKNAALRIDPLIPTTTGVCVRLSRLVADVGWEYAKIAYPEVRRVLQYVGQTVRDTDPGFWIRSAMPALDAADNLNLPVVVTDVRYENEAIALQKRGFMLIRVTRPGAGLDGPNGKHASETALDHYPADATITNGGSVPDLFATVDVLPLR
ncbi:deoxynucleotide monophosphate kinase family protein [Streptomyces sp. NBC_01244]|uniref:deoxynucleotide monophosphate kinase family protein n=1 Tax=Streptomyces sp. NBC_01244 TaxID=2903797 RepID=UPI002E10E2ED|nr:hypothetical protein OG247_17875 [Streptomyces sp. NBC_01244]